MSNAEPSGRVRLAPARLSYTLLVAVVLVGAAGCSQDPRLAGAREAVGRRDYDRALDLVNAAVALDPSDENALALKVDVLGALARQAPTPEARTALLADMAASARRAHALDSTDADVRGARVAAWLALVDHGNALLADPAAAAGASVPVFQDAVAVLPDSAGGHVGLALARYSAGDANGAVAPLRTAVRLAPNDPAVALRLGRILLDADQGADAVVHLERAADRFPNDAALAALLFVAYERTGRGADALTRYEAELAGATPAAEPALRLGYGTALIYAGRLDEAVAELERAVALAPQNADAHYNLGAALQQKAAVLGAEASGVEGATAADRLLTERDGYLERAALALTESRDLAAEGPDRTGACKALFQVYEQLGRLDDAADVAACAGISMN